MKSISVSFLAFLFSANLAFGQNHLIKEVAFVPFCMGIKKVSDSEFVSISQEINLGNGITTTGDSISLRIILFSNDSLLSNVIVKTPNHSFYKNISPTTMNPACTFFDFKAEKDSVYFYTTIFPNNKDSTIFAKFSTEITTGKSNIIPIDIGYHRAKISKSYFYSDSILFFRSVIFSNPNINRITRFNTRTQSFKALNVNNANLFIPIDDNNIIFGDEINQSYFNFSNSTFRYQDISIFPIDNFPNTIYAKYGNYLDSIFYYFTLSDSTWFQQNWNREEILLVKFNMKTGQYLTTESFLKEANIKKQLPYNCMSQIIDSNIIFLTTEFIDTSTAIHVQGYKSAGTINHIIKTDIDGNIIWERKVPTDHFDDPLDFRVFDDCMVATVARWRYQDLPNTYISDIVFFIFDLNGELLSTQSISSKKFDALKVYPNPVTKSQPIQVEIPESALGAEACIVSIDGKVNKTIKVDEEGTMEVSTTDLTPGHYVIQLHASGKGYAAPFVVR